MNTKSVLLAVVFILIASTLSGCFWNDGVATDQVAVIVNGGNVEKCVGPGVYTQLGYWYDLKEISAATVTFSVDDPEVATKDNQLIGLKITIQARRRRDCDSLKNLVTNWSPLLDDGELVKTVTATARESMKNGTRPFTMDQLLDDRNGLSSSITNFLEGDADKYSVDIINVTIENIALDPEYAKTLQDKALLTAQTELATKKQDLIKQQASNDKLQQEQQVQVYKEQLKAEEAKTSVEVEIASRQGKKTAAQYEVYRINPQAYELERLNRLQNILSDKSVIYFLPQGTDLSMILNTSGQQVLPYSTP